MCKTNVNKQAEFITSELYKISDMTRVIYESISYNADNGIDCSHIFEIIEILNNKIENLIEISKTQECVLTNIT